MDHSNLPPAAKLAALIEVGRATHPNMKHGVRDWISGDRACALGFAALACGLTAETIKVSVEFRRLKLAVGVSDKDWLPFAIPVTRMNDAGATLDEIILSLREGELAKVSVR